MLYAQVMGEIHNVTTRHSQKRRSFSRGVLLSASGTVFCTQAKGSGIRLRLTKLTKLHGCAGGGRDA